MRTLVLVLAGLILIGASARLHQHQTEQDCYLMTWPTSGTIDASPLYGPGPYDTDVTTLAFAQAGGTIVPVDSWIQSITVRSTLGPGGFNTMTHTVRSRALGATTIACLRWFLETTTCHYEVRPGYEVDQDDQLFEQVDRNVSDIARGYGTTTVKLCARH